jgi:Protein of unknown function (DUF3828)
MQRRIFLAAVLAAFCALPAIAEEQSPTQMIVEIYHIAAGPKGDYQAPSAIDDAKARQHFTKSLLAAKKAMDLRSKKLNEPILDFDPITNSQDPIVRNLAIAVETADAAKTIVAATFDSESKPPRNVVRYIFVREANAWKIDDIAGENGDDKWDLRDLMNPKGKK